MDLNEDIVDLKNMGSNCTDPLICGLVSINTRNFF